jgi:N6-L-threonylcarbamoyladenine synthase
MKVLAIETSCDDTSLAIVSYNWTTFICEKMISFSQVDVHLIFWGVVPELASREHLDQILIVFQSLVQWYNDENNINNFMKWIDRVVVTKTPWLPWSLIIWRTLAVFLSIWYNKPLSFVNHLYGHMFSFLLNRKLNILQEKNLILSVSWWHSDLSILSLSKNDNNWMWGFSKNNVIVDNIWQYVTQKIWTTRDDAIGEVYDKVSRLLGWPYPWWVWLSKKASEYIQNKHDLWTLPTIRFKRIMLEDWCFDFSFSGMKSQAYTFIEQYKKKLWLLSDDLLPDVIVQYICYEFQEAATDILVKKIFLAVDYYHISLIALVWGVSANTRLRDKIITYKKEFERQHWRSIQFYTPDSFEYCTDNAAMIGVAGIVSML